MSNASSDLKANTPKAQDISDRGDVTAAQPQRAKDPNTPVVDIESMDALAESNEEAEVESKNSTLSERESTLQDGEAALQLSREDFLSRNTELSLQKARFEEKSSNLDKIKERCTEGILLFLTSLRAAHQGVVDIILSDCSGISVSELGPEMVWEVEGRDRDLGFIPVLESMKSSVLLGATHQYARIHLSNFDGYIPTALITTMAAEISSCGVIQGRMLAACCTKFVEQLGQAFVLSAWVAVSIIQLVQRLEEIPRNLGKFEHMSPSSSEEA